MDLRQKLARLTPPPSPAPPLRPLPPVAAAEPADRALTLADLRAKIAEVMGKEDVQAILAYITLRANQDAAAATPAATTN